MRTTRHEMDAEQMLAHDIPLREGKVMARLTLPARLTRSDADRLCQIIAALAFDTAKEAAA